MNNSDKMTFKKIMDSSCDYYSREKITVDVIKIYFSALSEYSINEVSQAISEHMRDVKNGSFFPKISDICRHIDGPILSTDDIIAAARNANTPLGIVARIHIGSHDLKTRDAYYLKQRATEVIQNMSSIKSRSMNGNYTQHELRLMIENNIDPEDRLYPRFQKPNLSKALKMSVLSIKSEKEKENVEVKSKSNAHDDRISKEMSALVNKMCKKG